MNEQNKENIKKVIFVLLGIMAIYIIYKLYINYKNSSSTSNSNSNSTNLNTSSNNSGNYGYATGYASILSPINFASTDPQNGILASYNSYVNDNVGDATNSNLQNEYLNNSSFTSANPLFVSPKNNNVFNATAINTNTNLIFNPNQQPSALQSGSLLIQNPDTESNINTLTIPNYNDVAYTSLVNNAERTNLDKSLGKNLLTV